MLKLIAFLVLAAGGVSAEAAEVTLLGNPNCGDWIKVNSAVDRAWLAGYMSGLNVGISPNSKLDSLDGMTGNQVYLWMDNYCKANPLSDLNRGGNELQIQLERRRKPVR